METRKPRVSLGLPVYNGEKFLAEAIDSILNQTFTDFELIISDNASTDTTRAICLAYAAEDNRVRYYPSEKNHGAAWNFNRVFHLANSDYFKWVAHDDLLAPTFLEACVTTLDNNPEVVIAYPRVKVIDDDGAFLYDYTIKLGTDDPDPASRFHDLLLSWHLCFEIFGVIRTEALNNTNLIGNFGHGDGVLLEQLCFQGLFHEIPDYLFFSRKHKNQSMNVYGVYEEGTNDYYHYTAWFDTSKRGKIIFPNWRLLWEHYRLIWEAKLSFAERLRCHYDMGHWAGRNRFALLGDLHIVTKQLLSRAYYKLPYIDPPVGSNIRGNSI